MLTVGIGSRELPHDDPTSTIGEAEPDQSVDPAAAPDGIEMIASRLFHAMVAQARANAMCRDSDPHCRVSLRADDASTPFGLVAHLRRA